jgi:hypothetical protein
MIFIGLNLAQFSLRIFKFINNLQFFYLYINPMPLIFVRKVFPFKNVFYASFVSFLHVSYSLRLLFACGSYGLRSRNYPNSITASKYYYDPDILSIWLNIQSFSLKFFRLVGDSLEIYHFHRLIWNSKAFRLFFARKIPKNLYERNRSIFHIDLAASIYKRCYWSFRIFWKNLNNDLSVSCKIFVYEYFLRIEIFYR